ncbi:MAG: hypothetical protein WCO23_01800 [bacterium]
MSNQLIRKKRLNNSQMEKRSPFFWSMLVIPTFFIVFIDIYYRMINMCDNNMANWIFYNILPFLFPIAVIAWGIRQILKTKFTKKYIKIITMAIFIIIAIFIFFCFIVAGLISGWCGG